ncbi:MAG TPA: hypothetical protein DC054_01950 [Blastocatellia bacterium]|nr:hypothetical protein [Blastocatellia bacterium]
MNSRRPVNSAVMPFLVMNRTRTWFTLATVCCLGLCISSAAQSTSAPEGWHSITDNSFTFQLPDEMTETKNLGDYLGHMRTFGGKRIPYFTLNYRLYTCDTTTPGKDKPNVERSIIDVHGRKGVLTIGPSPNDGHFLAVICFANVDADRRRLKFYAAASTLPLGR